MVSLVPAGAGGPGRAVQLADQGRADRGGGTRFLPTASPPIISTGAALILCSSMRPHYGVPLFCLSPLGWCSTAVSEEGKTHSRGRRASGQDTVARRRDHHLAPTRTTQDLTTVPRGQIGGSSSRRSIGRLGAGGFALARAGIDQRTRLVIDRGACGRQAGPGRTIVVAAQQQINRVRTGRCRWHHHRDHRPGGTATGASTHSKRPDPVTRVVHRPANYGPAVQKPRLHGKSVTRWRSVR